jgi:copper chaperone CopZ
MNIENSDELDLTTDVLVSGMTCSHCVMSVTEELTAIDGVEDVRVDLNAGGASRVTIRSSAPIDEARVQAAVEEAGYSVAGPAA